MSILERLGRDGTHLVRGLVKKTVDPAVPFFCQEVRPSHPNQPDWIACSPSASVCRCRRRRRRRRRRCRRRRRRRRRCRRRRRAAGAAAGLVDHRPVDPNPLAPREVCASVSTFIIAGVEMCSNMSCAIFSPDCTTNGALLLFTSRTFNSPR